MMKMILSLAVLMTLALAPTGRASAGAAAPPLQMPALAGCWTLTESNDLNLPANPTVRKYMIDFTVDGTKSVGRYHPGRDIQPTYQWQAEILEGTSVFYVPMSMHGDSPNNAPAPGKSYLAVYAGIADSADRITGTWVDMRGIIVGRAQGNEVQIDPGHKIIFPIQSGWFRLVKGCSP